MRDGPYGPSGREWSGAHDLTIDRTGAESTRRTSLETVPDVDAPTTTTGTTIVGVRTDEGVVLAADRRASLGGRFVSNKDAEKVEQVHPTGAVALSGGVGPIQSFAQQLRAEANLYESRRGEPMTMEALSTAAGNLIRGVPAQVVLGGVTPTGPDEGTPHLYELDGGGSVMPATYAAGGSGIQTAYGVLENTLETDAPALSEAKAAAARAVDAASERDTASGNGLTLSAIDVNDVTMTIHDDPMEVP
jgi:proteasome beta subunit